MVNLVLRSGFVGIILWFLLLAVLVFGITSAIRRRSSGFYWAIAHLHFLVFVHVLVYGKAFVPCLCLTPWCHDPHPFMSQAIVSFFAEALAITCVGVIVTLRSSNRPAFAWLPLISCVAISADAVSIWLIRMEMFKLTVLVTE